MTMHLFCYTHDGGENISHDVVQDVFASIMKDVKFHILHEQTHILSLSII
jgi:hypothetical protein